MSDTEKTAVQKVLSSARRAIERHAMFSPGDLAVVAVSGGPDSMCLLDVLGCLAGELGLRLHVAHLNHHMRDQAESDARMVSEASERYGIPCTVGHADVPKVAQDTGTGLEEAGRIARYRFFRQVKEAAGAQKIALGHNLNDQAETVLMRLFRGGGTEGLAGIRPAKGDVVRPLIYVPREWIEEYCREKNLPTIIDVYNLDLRFTRNMVRRKVLPLLSDLFNPSLAETLSQVATALRWDADLLAELAGDAFLGISTREGRLTAVDRTALTGLPPAISSRVLEAAWRECSGSASNLEIERIEDILAGPDRVISLPAGVTAEKAEDVVRFYPAPPAGLDLPLEVPGEMEVPELGIAVSTKVVDGAGTALSAVRQEKEGKGLKGPALFVETHALLDYNRLREPVRLRLRREGDRFAPLGMGGKEQKLQDFLVSRRVPRFYRGFVPLLVSGDEIAWVVGQRLSERFKVDTETVRVLEVEVKPHLRPSRNYATICRSFPTSGRVHS